MNENSRLHTINVNGGGSSTLHDATIELDGTPLKGVYSFELIMEKGMPNVVKLEMYADIGAIGIEAAQDDNDNQ